jgi:hypothetical protein
MAIRDLRTAGSGSRENGKERGDVHAGAGHDDACRCKETSKMTPRELLKLMMSDLAFWKKAKKGQ